MRFYAAEIILGLEHMHNRFVVYRDLKVDSESYYLSLQTIHMEKLNECITSQLQYYSNYYKSH